MVAQFIPWYWLRAVLMLLCIFAPTIALILIMRYADREAERAKKEQKTN